MTNYLNEAFQRLSLLEDDFPLSENDAIKRLQEYMADDIEMPEEEVIIDPEAEDESDLQDSYIGKVILECGACHTRVYNDEEDVVIDEETGMANVGDECPVCGATTGWNVIGKIESYDADRDVEAEAEKIEDGEEEEIEEPEEPSDEPVDDDIDVEEEAEEEVEESLDEALEDDDVCPECGNNPCTCMDKKHKKIKEAKNSDVLKKKLKGLKEEADCDEDLKEELEQSDLQASDELAVEDDKRLEDPNDDPVEEDPQVLEEGLLGAILGGVAGNWLGGKFGKELLGTSAGAAIGSALGDITYNKIFGKLLDDENSIQAILRKSILAAGAGASADLLKQYTPLFDKIGDWISKSGDTKVNLTSDQLNTFKELSSMADSAKNEDDSKNIISKLVSLFSKKDNDNKKKFSLNLGGKIANFIKDKAINYATRKLVGESLQGEDLLIEGIENLSLDTEDTHMEMTSDENGKVTVSTEPLGASEEPMEGEMIAPLDSEEQADIEANSAEDDLAAEDELSLEEPVEDEGEFDEFDEESFDEMGESYMRKVYENVDSFKTTNVSEHNDQLIVEGVIKFSSGKEKNTKFIFENAKQTKRGKIVLEGINNTFSNTKKSFILKGSVNNKKYISESMIYSYKTKQLNESNESEVIKVHGRVKRK